MAKHGGVAAGAAGGSGEAEGCDDGTPGTEAMESTVLGAARAQAMAHRREQRRCDAVILYVRRHLGECLVSLRT